MYPKTSIFILYYMHVHTGYIHVHVNVSVFNCKDSQGNQIIIIYLDLTVYMYDF